MSTKLGMNKLPRAPHPLPKPINTPAKFGLKSTAFALADGNVAPLKNIMKMNRTIAVSLLHPEYEAPIKNGIGNILPKIILTFEKIQILLSKFLLLSYLTYLYFVQFDIHPILWTIKCMKIKCEYEPH
uniref:Uncharacterized protein n=1 Tax=Clastoptera arizonana TaxID=38151 RepID=A0A1B6C424_9HEMI